jgi:phage terminase large subunit-like protein
MNFSINKAERIRRFIEKYCTYTKGEWAGQKFKLLPWQWDELIKPLFGTLNDDGYRQYRTAYVEIPKKNGKSELVAALGIYMLTNDGEDGAEVYLAASDREQASIVYQAAASMVRNNDDLGERLKCLDSRKRIIYQKKNSLMQVLSSESYTKHGLSPSCVIIDEIHAHPSDELWNVLTAGTDYARRQQVVLVITTAGVYDKNSIWWRLRTKAIQVRDGIIKDPRFLPVLYLADPEKDRDDDEELWKRVNPSLGQIFTLDKIRQDYEEARQNPIDLQNFRRFRLNIPIRQISKWMPMDAWDRCAGQIDLEILKGKKCYGGLDMSTKIDLTSFVLVFPPQEGLDHYVILPHFYCPEDTIMQRSRQDAVHYEIWKQEGFLTATPGNVVDEEFIEKDVVEASKLYSLQEVGFDPWGATAIANKLFNTHGVKMVEVRQGAKSMSEPAKDILVKVKNGNLSHGGHPVLRWCADNLVMVLDANENVRPDKERATERIDGMVAMINAWNRIINNNEQGPLESVGFMIVSWIPWVILLTIPFLI